MQYILTTLLVQWDHIDDSTNNINEMDKLKILSQSKGLYFYYSRKNEAK